MRWEYIFRNKQKIYSNFPLTVRVVHSIRLNYVDYNLPPQKFIHLQQIPGCSRGGNLNNHRSYPRVIKVDGPRARGMGKCTIVSSSLFYFLTLLILYISQGLHTSRGSPRHYTLYVFKKMPDRRWLQHYAIHVFEDGDWKCRRSRQRIGIQADMTYILVRLFLISIVTIIYKKLFLENVKMIICRFIM